MKKNATKKDSTKEDAPHRSVMRTLRSTPTSAGFHFYFRNWRSGSPEHEAGEGEVRGRQGRGCWRRVWSTIFGTNFSSKIFWGIFEHFFFILYLFLCSAAILTTQIWSLPDFFLLIVFCILQQCCNKNIYLFILFLSVFSFCIAFYSQHQYL